MELANSRKGRIRRASREDAGEIGRLLSVATMRHLHSDWHLPVDWLGTPGFVVCERERADSIADGTGASTADGAKELAACLAVGADPPPAAWVRVAAVKRRADAERCLGEMLHLVLPWLRDSGVSILGWLDNGTWPEPWLARLGLRKVNGIITYRLDLSTVEITSRPFPAIRPATAADMARLAEIERAAFDPLWRHSQHGLLMAFREAMSFDVAEVDGRIAGFQYSVAGQDSLSAHLVRLTVAPDAQGRGVGGGLLSAALLGYGRMGAEQVTLNTQADNHASHHLYERFGFQRLIGRADVWALALDK
jgi:ribosomal protein S18 acetylase RimI-like enzyme